MTRKKLPFLTIFLSLLFFLSMSSLAGENSKSSKDGKLRIIIFGAHPDDCEIKADGIAVKWAKNGFHVKLKKNPLFLYMSDRFQKPNPFDPDIVVGIDEVFDQKIAAIWSFESQIESLWSTGGFEQLKLIPVDPAGREKFRLNFQSRFARRDASTAQKYRDKLIMLYDEKRGKTIQYAEAFEICEYGRQPSIDELKELFLIK